MAYAGSQAGAGLVWRRYDVCKTFAGSPKAALQSQLEPFSPTREITCKSLGLHPNPVDGARARMFYLCSIQLAGRRVRPAPGTTDAPDWRADCASRPQHIRSAFRLSRMNQITRSYAASQHPSEKLGAPAIERMLAQALAALTEELSDGVSASIEPRTRSSSTWRPAGCAPTGRKRPGRDRGRSPQAHRVGDGRDEQHARQTRSRGRCSTEPP
jgi:hypothetical protein